MTVPARCRGQPPTCRLAPRAPAGVTGWHHATDSQLDIDMAATYPWPVGGHRRGIIRMPELHDRSSGFRSSGAFVRGDRRPCTYCIRSAVSTLRKDGKPDLVSLLRAIPMQELHAVVVGVSRHPFVDAPDDTAVQSRRNHSGLRTVPCLSRRPPPRPVRPSTARAPSPSARRANTASG
jgi:hypothetical protein